MIGYIEDDNDDDNHDDDGAKYLKLIAHNKKKCGYAKNIKKYGIELNNFYLIMQLIRIIMNT